MSPPYRDELASLRAENERLRAALRARRRTRFGITTLLVILTVVALFVMQPWLNATSDSKFWGAMAVVCGLGITAALSAFGYRSSGKSSG